MFQLSEEQVEKILQRIRAEYLLPQELEAELLDHFCCFIEENASTEEGIELAYEAAKRVICPNGLEEIVFERFVLLNFEKQLRLKKSDISRWFCRFGNDRYVFGY